MKKVLLILVAVFVGLVVLVAFVGENEHRDASR